MVQQARWEQVNGRWQHFPARWVPSAPRPMAPRPVEPPRPERPGERRGSVRASITERPQHGSAGRRTMPPMAHGAPAHVTLAASLGLGVYAAGHRTRAPRSSVPRGARRAGRRSPPVVGTRDVPRPRGPLGFTHERQSASAAQVDPLGTFLGLFEKDLDLQQCMVRIAPSLPPRARREADPERTSADALLPACLPHLFARTGDGGDVEDLVAAVRQAKSVLEMGDTFVRLRKGMPREDTSWLAWAVDIGVRIADRLVRSRAKRCRHCRGSRRSLHRSRASRALRSLAFDRARLAVTGSAGDVATAVALSTLPAPDRRYVLEATASYAPLGVGLCVFPRRAVGGFVHAFLRDIDVGDPAFDAAFVVQTRDKSHAARLLLPELRQHLLAMASRAPLVRLEDDHIMVELPPNVTDPASLGYALDDVATAAHLLLRAVRGPAPQVGPYR